jgi:hypothetical protein
MINSSRSGRFLFVLGQKDIEKGTFPRFRTISSTAVFPRNRFLFAFLPQPTWTKSVAKVFLNAFREVVTTARILSVDCAIILKHSLNFNLFAVRNCLVAASWPEMPHNLLAMEDSEMGFDDEVSLPDESWSCGWEDDGEDNEEDEMEVTDGMDALEISDTHRALRYIEENGLEFLRLDDCIERLREQQREQEEIKRQSHHRVTDLWTTTWGRMLQSPQLNVPTSWEHRVFMRRFRLPYQLFKQVRHAHYLLTVTANGRGRYMIKISDVLVLDCYPAYLRRECMASYANSPKGCWDTVTNRKAKKNCRLKVGMLRNGTWRAQLIATSTIEPDIEHIYDYLDEYVYDR